MKGFKELSAVALSLLACTVYAHEGGHDEPEAEAEAVIANSDVHILKTDTFDAFVKENPLVLAECLCPPLLAVVASARVVVSLNLRHRAD